MTLLQEFGIASLLRNGGNYFCPPTYFIAFSHPWMKKNGIAGWLIPSEFMDVNYGQAVKDYLLNEVTLLQVHRFDPSDVQFHDALVSSAVVWFKNKKLKQTRTAFPILKISCLYWTVNFHLMKLNGFTLNCMRTFKNAFKLAYPKGICTKVVRFGIHKKTDLKAGLIARTSGVLAKKVKNLSVLY